MTSTTPTGFALRHSSDVARTLSLTFDDGPDPTWTPRILKRDLRNELRKGTYVRPPPGLLWFREQQAGQEHEELGHDKAQGTSDQPAGTRREAFDGISPRSSAFIPSSSFGRSSNG